MFNRVKVFAAALVFVLGGSVFAQTQYEVLFQCHMGVQILVGNFDPAAATDHVYARGSFNGWGTDDEMAPSFINDSLYEAVVFMNLTPVADTVAYKYMYTSVAAGDVWEGGDNKLFWATGNETDLNGNGIPDLIIPVRFFDGIGYGDIFTEDTEVIFEVDMRPAHAFLADSSAITFGGGNVTAIDTVYLAGGAPKTVPQLAWVWDLQPGDPVREALQMNDAGLDGDAVPGDSIWSKTILFQSGAPKVIDWKFGIAGFDNEAGFAQNHNANVAKASGRVPACFGTNGNFYTPYLGLCTVSIQPIANQVPDGFRLLQNYPNPFNPNTTIEFALTQKSDVRLVVYNLLGQQVRVLANESVNPGVYKVEWDGKDELGQKVASGIYLYRITAGNYVETKKMVLMK